MRELSASPKLESAQAGYARSAARTVGAEIEGLIALAEALENGLRQPFETAIARIAEARGRVVVSGMGKSGHVARKIAATLSSTGTPAIYLHPAEASHGDLGMITRQDVLMALSWSGETPELRDVIHYCKRFAVPLLGLTSVAESALADAADVALILPQAAEACQNTRAPTTSTTMMMAFGDALAVALLEARGFSAADFRNFHPGGTLGAQLVTVGDLMARGDQVPIVAEDVSLAEAIVEMTRKRYGGVAVIDPDGLLVGVFTDGDLRRALPTSDLSAPMSAHMTRSPVTADPHLMATEAMRLMTERPHPIQLLIVCIDSKPVGAVGMHDLLHAGIA
jgi:arabinose-5-phosphate isomerase